MAPLVTRPADDVPIGAFRSGPGHWLHDSCSLPLDGQERAPSPKGRARATNGYNNEVCDKHRGFSRADAKRADGPLDPPGER